MSRGALVFLVFVSFACALAARAESNSALRVERLNGGRPIISGENFARLRVPQDGSNINGPSLIRVPDWIPPEHRANPNAQYYLYFASHHGYYIRMAWAAEITGPYHPFNVGLALRRAHPGRGVLDLGPEISLHFVEGVRVYDHIASPDVHVDHDLRRIVLYFHGRTNAINIDSYFATREQKTLVATAPYGLNFNNPVGEVRGGVGRGHPGHGVRNVILGNAYFRVFRHESGLYAFSNYGRLWRAEDAEDPWRVNGSPRNDAWQEKHEANPIYANLSAHYRRHGSKSRRDYAGFTGELGPDGKDKTSTGAPRHFAVRPLGDAGDEFEIWYTSRGDRPERIFRTTMKTSGPWWKWRTAVTDKETVHDEVLRPELAWEGAGRPLELSKAGSDTNVNQLRDPALFQDADGQWYLVYCGGGEEGIGLARVIDPQ